MADFTGTAGNDSLVGTEARDTFYFSLGDDTLIGGVGIDWVSAFYPDGAELPDGAVLDLELGTLVVGGFTQTYVGIEGFQVEFSRNVTLRGDGEDNDLNLTAIEGDAVIEGRGGNDTLYVMDTTATVEGGSGIDTLQIGASSTDYTLTTNAMGQRVLSWDGGASSATLLDEIESFYFVKDQVTLHDEELINRSYFFGTAGDDSLVGTDRDATFELSSGNDTLIGGAGVDRATGFLPDGSVVDLALGTITHPDFIQRVAGIEQWEIDGDTNVTLRGDGQDNDLFLRGDGGVIEGAAGNDKLHFANGEGAMYGGDGDDVFDMFGSSHATIEGGDGADQLIIAAFADDISVSTNDAGQRVISWNTQTATLLDEVESFVFNDGTSLSYDEISPAPPITGTDASEAIAGTDAADEIVALGGNDWITPGTGRDVIDGGEGIDTVSYVGKSSVWVDLSRDRVLVWDNIEAQSLIGIENATGTSKDDSLKGNEGANVLRGLGGFDTFFATAGGDLLMGGTGPDRLYVGEAGEDTSVSLLRGRIWEGEGTGTRLNSIEFVLSKGGNDKLTGDHTANIFNAGEGDDTVMGNGGDDILYGGMGEDIALYTKAQDQYEITPADREGGYTPGPGFQVAYIGPGVADGTDQVFDIETLRFADGDLVL